MASTVWRGNIAFGLVSIPVRLIRAARRERIRFRQVYRTSTAQDEVDDEPEFDSGSEVSSVAPVQRVHVASAAFAEPSATPDLVPANQILKGSEIEPNRFITFRADEVKALKPKTSSTIEITSFLHLEEIDPIYFDASYYIVPQSAGEKPYAILFGSLQRTKFTALGQMAMHGREHAVVLRAGAQGLILETLFYENEVHREDQYSAATALAAPGELKMAEAFIHAMTAEFNPAALVDQYEKRLQALIDARASDAAPGAIQAPPAAAPVVDILEALRKSLEQVRKPAAKETRPKRRRAS